MRLLGSMASGVQAAVNKRFHQRGASVRVQDLFITKSGKYRGSTRATNSAEHLLEHRNEVILTARTADPSVTGLQARTTRWWIKAHAIPVARYLGKGSRGTDVLREKLEVENEGVRILHRQIAERRCQLQGLIQQQDHRGIVGGLRRRG